MLIQPRQDHAEKEKANSYVMKISGLRSARERSVDKKDYFKKYHQSNEHRYISRYKKKKVFGGIR